jgi:hypothetical protein
VTKRTSEEKPLPTIWRTPEELWEEIEPILTEHDPPKKTGRWRIDRRAALDALIFRLRTGGSGRAPQAYRGIAPEPVFGQGLRQTADEGTGGRAKLHPSHPTDRRGEALRGRREAPPCEAVGRRMHVGLAFEVSVYPGALREEGIELPGDDQDGCTLVWYRRQRRLSVLK